MGQQQQTGAVAQAAAATVAGNNGDDATQKGHDEKELMELLLDEEPELDAEPAEPADVVEGEQAADELDQANPEADSAESNTPATDGSKPAQQPGTPDKALQRMQQDLSAVMRQLGEIGQKVNAGQSLTPKEQQQVQTATRKAAELKQKLASGFDVIDDGQRLAESVVETDERVTALEQQIQALHGELKTGAEQKAWQAAEKEFAGVDVRGVWEKSVESAMKSTGITVEQAQASPQLYDVLHRQSQAYFRTRATAAAKAIATTTAPAAGEKTKRSTTARTAGGAQVTQRRVGVQTTPPKTEEQRHMEDYMKLVKDD